MKMMSSDLQTSRGRHFFGFGMVIFPVFWVWWLSRKHFTARQIRIGRAWTVVYALAALAAWLMVPEVPVRASYLSLGYAHVCFLIGLGLWGWLLWRMVRPGLFEIVFGVVIFARPLAVMIVPWFNMLERHPGAVFFVFVPALAHLLVEPIRRQAREQKAD